MNTVKKICPYPFSKITLGAGDHFVPCCISWLTKEYFELDHSGDPWNSLAAQKLRENLLNGEDKYCQRQYCQQPLVDVDDAAKNSYGTVAAPISEKNWSAILNDQVIMPEGPSTIAIIADDRCNLACPSCRSEKKTTLREDELQKLIIFEKYLATNSQFINNIKFTNGEVFFSPWMSQILKNITKDSYPSLSFVSILTNGLLFNRDKYIELMPGSSFIKAVSVSIDAGDAATYSVVRKGNWALLLENLKWISQMRQENIFKYFQINFTVQKNNYLSIENFVNLGNLLNVDSIKFTALFDWDRMAINYSESAIHLTSHPAHQELYNIYNLIKSRDKVEWALPIPQNLNEERKS